MIPFLSFLTLGFYIFFLTILNKDILIEGKIEINSKNKIRDKALMDYLKIIEDYLVTMDYQVHLEDVGKKIYREKIPGDITLKWDPYHIEISGPPLVLKNISKIVEIEELGL